MSKDPPPSLRNLQSSKFELAQDLDRIIENNSVLSKVIYIYSSFFKTQLKLKPLALALLIATLCPLSQGDLINSAKATQTPSSWLYFDTTGGTIKDQNFSGLSGDSSYDYGGAIHSEGPLNVQGNVSFSGNTTLEYGGAIYSSNTVTLSGGLGEISFLKNSVSLNGGAIYANNINISSDAGNIIFSGNTSESYGGALYSTNDVSIASDSGSITFSGNSSANRGGAIYTNKNINITSNSGKITFSDNSSQQKGGAIYTNGGQIISTSGEINFSNNSSDHAATIVREGDYFYACFEYRVNVPETQSLTALMEDCEGLDRGVVIPIQLSDGTKYATELKERTGVSPIALAIT